MFGIVSAASDEREPTCVRSGPTSPFAAVPRIVWQLPHLSSKSVEPALGAGRDSRASQRLNCARWVREDVDPHVRVLQAAELGALAAIAAGLSA